VQIGFGLVTAHPYRMAWRTRDLEAWAAELASDVVLHSPIVTKPFLGREAATELFAILFETFDEFKITAEFRDGGSHVFFWQSRVGGRMIEGTDLVRLGEDGKVCEIRVLIRPLVGIADFAAAIGPRLAAKRSRIRGPLVRLLNLPIRAMFSLIDILAARLTQRRS
jgi:hypothetical protein